MFQHAGMNHSFAAQVATVRTSLCALLALAILFQAAPAAVAQMAPGKSAQLPHHELIREFDFEEPYGESVPIDWHSVRGRQYPAYTRGRLVNDLARGGAMSFRIDLNGGNCSYEYDRRRMPIQTDYDYCVEGWIRTEGLQYSGASLGAWLNDHQGRTIETSRVRTVAVSGTNDWRLVRVYVSSTSGTDGRPYADPPRYLCLSMDVIGGQAQDIGGRVWFDSIRIFRLPRVRMNVAGGVFHEAGGSITAGISAEGLGDGTLDGWLIVRNSRGRLLSRSRVGLKAPSIGEEAVFNTSIDDLQPGVYEVVFDVAADRPTVMRRSRWLAVLAPWQSSPAMRGRGFGIEDITGMGDADDTAAAVAASGVRAAKVRLWNRSTSTEELRLGRSKTVALLEALGMAGVECIGVLGDPPSAITTAMAGLRPGIADLLGQPAKSYEAALGFTVSRYCGPVRRWQIGEAGDGSVLRLHQQADLLSAALMQMDRLTAAQPVALAWPALYDLPARLPQRLDAISLRVDESISPSEVAHYIPARSSAPTAAPLGIQLTLPAVGWSGQDADGRIIDFVHRVLAAKVAGVDEIFFEQLVDAQSGLMRAPNRPDELLLAARTMSDMLGAAQYVGRMQLESAGEALVFERDDGSEVIVLWHDDPRGTVLQPLYLGRQLSVTDIWGNRRPVPQADRVSTLTMTRMPVFVTGIDSRLSRMRRSFVVRGGSLEATYQRHNVQVQFENFFDMPLVGHARLRAPSGWKIDPQILTFHLATGERALFNVTLVVPYDETTGIKELIGDFHVPGDAPLRFRALAPIDLQMKSARTAALGYVRDGRLIIEQEVSNLTDAPITLRAYIQVPGRSMLSHMITDLKPGATVTKKYELPFEASLIGKQALVGIREEGVRRGFSNVLVPLGEAQRRTSQR